MIRSGGEEQEDHLLWGAHPKHVTERLHCMGRLDDLAVLSIQRQATQQLCGDDAAVPASGTCTWALTGAVCLSSKPAHHQYIALTGCCLHGSCQEQICPCRTSPGSPVTDPSFIPRGGGYLYLTIAASANVSTSSLPPLPYDT